MSNIHIPEPCHAKWNNMAPTEGGRYCTVCRKKVHDFTQWKTSDIEAIMASSPQPICGRIKSPVTIPAYIQRFKWLTVLVGVMVIFLASCRRHTVGVMAPRKPAKSVKTLTLQQDNTAFSQHT